MAIPNRTLTTDGLEMQVGTNHFGHFLLTNLLIDRLIEGAPSRVVNVSSAAHQMGIMDFENLNSEKSYSAWKTYGLSKLMNVHFANELNRRYSSKQVFSNSLHPGVIPTELGRNQWAADFFYTIGNLFMKTIPQGASTTVYVAVAPELESVGGKYFQDCNLGKPTAASQDEKNALRLWEVSEKLVGLNQTSSQL